MGLALIGDREHRKKSRLVSWLILVSSLLFQVGMEGAPRHDSRTHEQTLNHKEGNHICLFKQDLATEIPQLEDQLISISVERLPVLQHVLGNN